MASSIRSFFNKLFSTSNCSRTSCTQSSDGGDYALLSECPPAHLDWSSCVYRGQLQDGSQQEPDCRIVGNMKKQNDKEDPIEDAVQKCKEEMQLFINKINRSLLGTIKTVEEWVTGRDEKIARLKKELQEVRSQSALEEGELQPSLMEEINTIKEQIAVKRLKCELFKDIPGFSSEAQFLGRFRHENLLTLKGYCAEGLERMLVFDYMPNLSLYAHLHGDLEKKEQLDWHSRMAIARGCAQGLMYLHHDADFELVHGNIKSTNVLLGPTFAPKIVDFGLSRLLNDSVARAKGAFGYAPPEDTGRGFHQRK
ncbi:hypothetical protein L7F22_042544 [Adiantum nelumboides]|nr:hypothetical protein [Adiantum nelumboides]